MSRISNDLSMIAEIAHHCPEDLIISFLAVERFLELIFNEEIKFKLISPEFNSFWVLRIESKKAGKDEKQDKYYLLNHFNIESDKH